jgi:hypothetical protein
VTRSDIDLAERAAKSLGTVTLAAVARFGTPFDLRSSVVKVHLAVGAARQEIGAYG